MGGLGIGILGSFILLASSISSLSSKDYKSVRALINLFYELAVSWFNNVDPLESDGEGGFK